MAASHDAAPPAPPFRFSRESRIRIDREGRFFHEDEPVLHPGLARGLASWVALDEATGRYVLRNALDWCFVAVDDAPLVVRSARVEPSGQVQLELSDGSVEPLDLGTLRVDADSVPYCDVRDGTVAARFSRSAAFALLEHAVPLAPSGDESEGYVLALAGGPVVPLRRVPSGQGARRVRSPA